MIKNMIFQWDVYCAAYPRVWSDKYSPDVCEHLLLLHHDDDFVCIECGQALGKEGDWGQTTPSIHIHRATQSHASCMHCNNVISNKRVRWPWDDHHHHHHFVHVLFRIDVTLISAKPPAPTIAYRTQLINLIVFISLQSTNSHKVFFFFKKE